MIPCNGSHVILHAGEHGKSVYRCTMENAKKLLVNCLVNEAPDLSKLVDKLQGETRQVRGCSWLTKALAEVRDLKESPARLRTVLYGVGPRERDAEDTRPMPVITKEMQAELVLSFFNSKLKLEALDSSSPMTVSQLTAGWSSLTFLELARQRLGDVVFVDDHLFDGYNEFRTLLEGRWKGTAREENIIGNNFCPFLSDWGSGRWSVEPITDA